MTIWKQSALVRVAATTEPPPRSNPPMDQLRRAYFSQLLHRQRHSRTCCPPCQWPESWLLLVIISGIITAMALAATAIAMVASVALVVAATTANDASGFTAKIDRCGWVFPSLLRLPRGLVCGRIMVGTPVITMNVMWTIGVSIATVVVVVRVPVMMVRCCTNGGLSRSGRACRRTAREGLR